MAELAKINPPELAQVKQLLVQVLLQCHTMENDRIPRKILKELIFLVSKVVMKEFCESPEDCPFLTQLIDLFAQSDYSQVLTRLLV